MFGGEESMDDNDNGFNIDERFKGKCRTCTREVHKQKLVKCLVKDGCHSRQPP